MIKPSQVAEHTFRSAAVDDAGFEEAAYKATIAALDNIAERIRIREYNPHDDLASIRRALITGQKSIQKEISRQAFARLCKGLGYSTLAED